MNYQYCLSLFFLVLCGCKKKIWGLLVTYVPFFFCSPSSSRGPVQPAPCQGAAERPELDAAQSDYPCWQVCPGGQRQHLDVPTGDHSQMAAAAQQPADPQGRRCLGVSVYMHGSL